jgi:5,5'-dehydrodivanillate O-demethylase
MHLRVPLDDHRVATFAIQALIKEKGPYTTKCRGWRDTERGVYNRVEDGYWNIANEDQDRAAQESQGLIVDRSHEYLGTSDSGVVAYRKMLEQAIRDVREGRDPIGVIRDPTKNQYLRFDATMNFADGKNEAPAIIEA